MKWTTAAANVLVVMLRVSCLTLVIALLGVGARAQISSSTDGSTPLGIAPGAPAGSYALNGFDTANLFNGSLNFALPLMHIGGRGAAQMTMTLAIESHWRILQFASIGTPPPGTPSVSYFPLTEGWGSDAGYGPGVLLGRRGSKVKFCGGSIGDQPAITLTRLTFVAPDGTEYELRDAQTQGKPIDGSFSACSGQAVTFDRGTIFVSADGTSMTFIVDAAHPIIDTVGNDLVLPSGYLLLRDGTCFRIEDSLVMWIRDRNGNRLDFTYDQFDQVTSITDSLNRVVTISHWDLTANPPIWHDEITFRGFGGAARTIKVWYGNLSQSHDPADAGVRPNLFRTGVAQGSSAYTMQTMSQLFPEIGGGLGAPNDNNDPWVRASVELPDGRHYRFFYNSYAELARVELPTGGAYEYDYQTSSGVVFGTPTVFGPQIYRRLIERRVYPDGQNFEQRTTYETPVPQNGDPAFVQVNHLDQAGSRLSRERHYFNGSAKDSLFQEAIAYADYLDGKEYQTEMLDPNDNVLRRVNNTFVNRATVSWWGTVPDYVGGNPPVDPRLTDSVTALTDVTPNLVTKQTYAYDQFNNRTDTYEYDFGQTNPPAVPVRHTQTSFVVTNPVNNTDYTAINLQSPPDSIHLKSLPKDQSVYAINGSTGADVQPAAAQTSFEYDKYDASTNHAALLTRSAISGHDSTFSTGRTTRGNATEIKRWLDTNGSWIAIDQQYDIAGNIVTKIDAGGLATTIDFADHFGMPNGEARANTPPSELSSVSQTSFAFPTSVTNQLQHTAYTQYDYYIGRAVDGEDEKGVIDSGFYNDIFDRATQLLEATNTSDKRQTTYTYNDSSRIVTTTTDENSYADNQLKAEILYDGLGRQTESRHYESASTFIATQQTYDSMGRIRQVSNPYRPGDTVLSTTTDYDTLGRKITITTPDQAQAFTGYSGNSSTVTDQAAKKRTTISDALGRLTSATEDPGSTPHLNYQTTYTYNVLDKLTHVTQGAQTRDYGFDSLGRLKLATIPEQIGSTAYTYYANSNLQTRTDPCGVVTTCVYDSLNRITSVSYDISNAPGVAATPSVTYSYDSPTVLYSKGELTGVSVTSVNFSSSYSYDEYDSMGRVKQSTQTTDGHAYTMKYGYDLAGHLKTEEYPSHRMITTSYDAAGRVITVNGTGRATPYAEQLSYTSHGELKEMKLGNGLWEHTISNSRLQLTEIGVGTAQGATDRLKLNYDYGTTANNGNLLSQTNTVPGSPTLTLVQSYGYVDGLNRLTSVQETANQTVRWTQSYVYDKYGNRTTLTNTGSEGVSLPTQSTPGVTSGTNRLVGFSYDNSGNVLSDGAGGSFVYDAENRQTSAGTSSYSYDGDGLRVRKVVNGVTNIFVYDALQRLVAEYASPDQQPQGGGGTSFLTSDHLGSTRLVTDASGSVKSRHDYLPFGEELSSGIGSRTTAMKYGAVDGLKQKFTSKQRDTESGLDYFGARYYSSPHARFTGVDPLMESAHPAMPQTWNRFAYVLNNPLVIIDPNGEGWLQLDGSETLYWDDHVNSQGDAERLYPKRHAVYLPPGTIMVVTNSSIRGLMGHSILLEEGRIIFDLGVKPKPITELEFYGGNGEKFLLAYFKFALENAVLGYIGAKAVDAVEALYQLAKARRAGKAAIEVLERAKGACFAAGTKVITAEGDKPIEELKEGDDVLSFDSECGEAAWQRVTRVYERTANELLDITAGGVRISCTPEHPFWIANDGWTAAIDLKPGSQLLNREGKNISVQSVRHRKGTVTVYNIEVDRLHSYYVSEIGVLVHDQCAAPRPLPFRDAALRARVNQVLDNIAAGAKQFARDGIEFMNKEGLLPTKPSGYYQEYTVPTPGVLARGEQRIVVGRGGEAFYTLDHYKSFVQIR
jgi:RHS repeat-associated protein